MTDTARPSVRGRPLPVKLAMGLAVMLYRFTDGGIGGRMAGNPVLLLTTIGRKSKKAHTIPLAYFEADGTLFVVASNGGASRHPSWYLNLLANPTIAIQRGQQVQKATATPASPERRVQLWQRLVAIAPGYGRYQDGTTREIPIVLLRPAG